MLRNEAPAGNILGDQVGLGPMRRDLIPACMRWRDDFMERVTWVTYVQDASAPNWMSPRRRATPRDASLVQVVL